MVKVKHKKTPYDRLYHRMGSSYFHNDTFFISSCKLKYARIFGINMRHDTYGVKQSPRPSTLQGSDQSLAPEIYVSFRLL